MFSNEKEIQMNVFQEYYVMCIGGKCENHGNKTSRNFLYDILKKASQIFNIYDVVELFLSMF